MFIALLCVGVHGCGQVRLFDRFCLCSLQMFTMQSLFSLECSLRQWTMSHILWEGGGWAPLIVSVRAGCAP